MMFLSGVHFIYRKHLSLVKPRNHDFVLDVGCGTGTILFKLRQRFGRRLRLRGIDPSPDMIIQALQQSSEKDLRIDFKIGVGHVINVGAGKINWIISCLSTHHMSRKERIDFFKEAHRTLDKDGTMVISDYGQPVNFLGEMIFRLFGDRHAEIDDLDYYTN